MEAERPGFWRICHFQLQIAVTDRKGAQLDSLAFCGSLIRQHCLFKFFKENFPDGWPFISSLPTPRALPTSSWCCSGCQLITTSMSLSQWTVFIIIKNKTQLDLGLQCAWKEYDSVCRRHGCSRKATPLRVLKHCLFHSLSHLCQVVTVSPTLFCYSRAPCVLGSLS